MKKEFIMPSLKMKKFNKEIVAELSVQNVEQAKNDLESNSSINKVAVITL